MDNVKLKPIFSKNINITRNAFINWRMGAEKTINMLNIAEGYMISTIALIEYCLVNNQNKKADIVIFPIFTNFNHGIELYLKANIRQLNKLLNNKKEIEKHHDLILHFKTLKTRIVEYEGETGLKKFEDFSYEIEEYVNELYKKIQASKKNNKMEFSRYPFDKKDVNFFYIQSIGNVEIDLENFVRRTKSIYSIFEAISNKYLYENEFNTP